MTALYFVHGAEGIEEIGRGTACESYFSHGGCKEKRNIDF